VVWHQGGVGVWFGRERLRVENVDSCFLIVLVSNLGVCSEEIESVVFTSRVKEYMYVCELVTF